MDGSAGPVRSKRPVDHQPFPATRAKRTAGAIDVTRSFGGHLNVWWVVAIVAAAVIAAIVFIAFVLSGGAAAGGGGGY